MESKVSYTCKEVKAEGKAVQLVQPKDAESGDAGGFILNEKALDEIFCSDEVKDKPIAIYSLTGAYRKGKSFLLNLFLRYMLADKKEEWIGDTTERLSKGFGWRGGTDGDTQGIWIWNKPFLFDAPHYKVNLFLMNTQGAFDLEADTKTSSVIFALSTLIGSVQIYNVVQMIGADDLQNLQLFAEYGKSATLLAEKNQIENSKPFQNLIFLIRDWADKDFEFGEEGGKKYLAKVFSKKTKSKEIKKVQEEIQNYFSKFTCYLLPSPGEKVMLRGAKDKKIQLGEIGKCFLSQVTMLNRHLFEPKNIVVKTNNGKVMTGMELSTFILTYFNIFKSGEMPKVATILEANMNATMISLKMKCLAMFKENMKKVCATYMKPAVFETKQNENRSQALLYFDKLPKIGDSDFVNASKKELEKEIGHELKLFRNSNETFKEKEKAKVFNLVESTVFTFKQDLNKASNESYVNDPTLAEIKQDCYTEALKSFQDQTEKFDESVIGENNTKLKKHLEIAFMEFKEKNRYRLGDLQQKLSTLSLEAKQKFNLFMKEKCSGKVVETEELKNAILNAQESALAVFDKSEVGNGSELKKRAKLELAEQLHEETKRFEDTNNITRDLEDAQTLQTLTQAKDAYNNYVYSVTGGNHIDPNKIEDVHKQGSKRAEALIDLCLKSKGEIFVQKCKTQLGKVLEDFKEELMSKNEIQGSTAGHLEGNIVIIKEWAKNKDKALYHLLLHRHQEHLNRAPRPLLGDDFNFEFHHIVSKRSLLGELRDGMILTEHVEHVVHKFEREADEMFDRAVQARKTCVVM